ncbi:eCIS core domain-containing protein [Sphingomonas hengshuiensis]|uniref:eCIS core domain-containing protein n=1 Tax=Sphingomonas hengshuiensis TaxID=1609977 RepID=UPI000A824FE3|nr:DUF4157 domain-containing protein [Sphingomonas hengshuiensis]
MQHAQRMPAAPLEDQHKRAAAIQRAPAPIDAAPRVAALMALSARLNAPAAPPLQRAATAPNRTGMPDALKAGIEQLSGLAMDDVRVHRDSPRPAQLQAHAFAQGADIHLAPGQEQHLPHEAWHVVQQKQGRVAPTLQLAGGVPVNDDAALEREADAMGARALADSGTELRRSPQEQAAGGSAVQLSPTAALVQRVLNIGGQPVAAPVAGQTPEVTAIIEGWINGGVHAFVDWDAAVHAARVSLAVNWLAARGWAVPAVDIVNPALTPQNCHGLTFGVAWAEFSTISEFLERWQAAHEPPVMLCLLNGEVAHSATLVDGMWQQTLPGGPVFRTDRAALAARYECFNLSDAGELEAAHAREDDIEATFQNERAAFLEQCFPATQVPENERSDRQHYEAERFNLVTAMVDYSPDNQRYLRIWAGQFENW